MGGTPWTKWYWSDWRSDPRLRMCSLAARGLWAEMLALMHEAQPYGHLLVAGNAPTDAQLAVLAGASPDEVPDLLRELESAGVFSRTKQDVIYSRRMIRDQKRAQNSRKNGSKGGNPTLRKQKASRAQDNPQDNGRDKAQSPEARVQSPDIRESPKGDSSFQPEMTPPNPVPYDDLKRVWNEVCGETLPKVERLTDQRRQKLRARWQKNDIRDLDDWRGLCGQIVATPFLCGENDRQWRANIDFVIRSDTQIAKLREGEYGRAEQRKRRNNRWI